MHKENKLAGFERGRIESSEAGGYTVASLDREGILSPPLPPMQNDTYAKGDIVLFCLFDDGTGAIICALRTL